MAAQLLAAAWIAFQGYILFYPAPPMVQRPAHLIFAMLLVLLCRPLECRWGAAAGRAIDAVLILATLASGVYYMAASTRLTERMEGVDPVLGYDAVFGALTVAVLLECVRRTVGWSLLGVILLFLAYGVGGGWAPGWLAHSGFEIEPLIELLAMSQNGFLGITTETSLQFVFYFVMFGAVYSAVGGGQLFIDIGLRISGSMHGGAAKAATISSSLMGSISGSAVANVATTGVFTIPLMRRAGYSAESAAAIEAIASTGGQLMPPIMGVAAFVAAEMLQVEYARIAVAGLIPAAAFYLALLLIVDLLARKTGQGTLPPEEAAASRVVPLLSRAHLLIPPVVLVAALAAAYSATMAAVYGSLACVAVSAVWPKQRLTFSEWRDCLSGGARQAAEVAAPIAAIGIIIAVAIQSNLALKFSSQIVAAGGSSLYGAMLLIVVGCIVMGMGLPTVAAYIIGAILFAPALQKLGIGELSAHFFVMYYCVLSMVTPPVALASFTAAGIANAHPLRTSMEALRLSFVCFLIPFAFAVDPHLLGEGSLDMVALAVISLCLATALWAIALAGYLRGPVPVWLRGLAGLCSVALILAPSGTPAWMAALGCALAALFVVAWASGKTRVQTG
ncbi:MAG: TRAP transporter fused permease subunit [Acidobacteria bacterium]|nr:TRAP transporter fused permease subunit [Acidobacteriota bacterium]MDA1235610.1 TRAP transporter fused permease subunit [Acidobacteriota bacterium]